MKRPSKDVVNEAKKRGLYTLIDGKGDNTRIDFWDKKTGKLVLVFYVARKSWVMPGAADRSGDADDYRSALSQAFDTQPRGD